MASLLPPALAGRKSCCALEPRWLRSTPLRYWPLLAPAPCVLWPIDPPRATSRPACPKLAKSPILPCVLLWARRQPRHPSSGCIVPLPLPLRRTPAQVTRPPCLPNAPPPPPAPTSNSLACSLPHGCAYLRLLFSPNAVSASSALSGPSGLVRVAKPHSACPLRSTTRCSGNAAASTSTLLPRSSLATLQPRSARRTYFRIAALRAASPLQGCPLVGSPW